MRHTAPQIDLRQELLQLNLNNCEVDSWLGNKFDEKEEYDTDFRFVHDIPLQKSISLDRGLDIVNYLNALSECTDSDEDVFWTIGPEEVGSSLRLEQYRSFEDIPASPNVRSRHVSVDVTNLYGNSSALTVLRESYKGMETDTGRVNPQIRKLRKTYSFRNFDEYRDSPKISDEHLEIVDAEIDMHRLQVRVPIHRSVSYGGKDKIEDTVNENVRQRRFGVVTNVWQENSNVNLRKEVLKKVNSDNFKSCDDIRKNKLNFGLGSYEGNESSRSKDKEMKCDTEAINNLRKLRGNCSTPIPKLKDSNLSKIIITEIANSDSITNNEANKLIDSSNSVVVLDRTCNCRICSESDSEQTESFLVKNFQKIFKKIVSYKDYGRNLLNWDENINFNDNAMFHCFIHILKMLLGLWLRHCDHKHHNLSVTASG